MKKVFALILTLALLSVMVVSVAAAPYDFQLQLRSAGISGLSLTGNTYSMEDGTVNGWWGNAQYMQANDDLKDGFTVKITDIKWDPRGDNAVTVVYGNTTNYMGTNACESGQGSNFTFLIKRDGGVCVWGNGFNTNHPWGKWVGFYHQKSGVLDANPTEFTCSMVPNEDNTVYTFYVNDYVICEYNVTTATEGSPLYHKYSILNEPDRPCNFGFQILSATGNNGTGHHAPTGSLSFTVAEIDSVGVAPANPLNPDDKPTTSDPSSSDTTGGVVTLPPLTTKAPSGDTTAADTTAPAPAGNNNTTTIIIAVSAVAAVAVIAAVVIVVVKKKK